MVVNDDTTGRADPAATLPDGYCLVERLPSVGVVRRLRAASDMARRSREGLERGLPNSVYGVVVRTDGTTVGMGRVVGDGGSVYHVCDMVVHPDHQGQGLGTAVMRAILAFLDRDAPPRAYVNLLADVDGFYEQFGFEETRPATKGMFLRTEDVADASGDGGT